MRLLLDTHVLIWWTGAKPLAPLAAQAIADGSNEILVSAASIWEAEIKIALGKLTVGGDLARQARIDGFAELPVHFDHASAAGRLAAHHKDPFDRMLIAQAQLEGLTIATRDPAFRAYGVALLAA